MPRKHEPEPYRPVEEVARIIVGAVRLITERQHDKVFIKVDRARRKSKNLEPTDIMARLLRYIRTHDGMTFEESLGADWRFLGGLFNRGLVTWRIIEGQQWRIMVTSAGMAGPADGATRH